MQLDLFKEALTPTVERLFDRHRANSRDWYPHEYIPYSRGKDFDPAATFDPDASHLSRTAQSALFINLLTEDNLPYYTHTLLTHLGTDSVWGEWSRRWTAEEGRHAMVIRDYLMVTQGVDPMALELGRMATMSHGWDSGWRNAVDGIVYPSLQELATRISHRNTGRFIEDPVGREVMTRVVTDENHHFLFYRDLVSEAIKVDPSSVMLSLAHVVQNFAMPGVGMPGFASHAKAVAAAGIYDFSVHHDLILQPVVMRHYKIESVEGLSPEAEVAREETIKFIERIGKIAARLADKRDSDKSTADEPAPIDFSVDNAGLTATDNLDASASALV